MPIKPKKAALGSQIILYSGNYSRVRNVPITWGTGCYHRPQRIHTANQLRVRVLKMVQEHSLCQRDTRVNDEAFSSDVDICW